MIVFSKDNNLAWLSYLEDVLGMPLSPNWNRMIAAIRGCLNLKNATAADDDH